MAIPKMNDRIAWVIFFCCPLAFSLECWGQLTVTSRESLSGQLEKLERNAITLKTAEGSLKIAFTRPGDESVPLEKAGVNLRHKTIFEVKGSLSLEELNVGQWVEFDALLSQAGKCNDEVAEFRFLDSATGKISSQRAPKNTRDYVPCTVVAKLTLKRRDVLTFTLPRQDFAPSGKLRIRAAKEAKLQVAENSLDRCQPGDLVKNVSLIKLDSGDRVAEKIVVQLASRKENKDIGKEVLGDPFSPKNYVQFSDQPSAPRDLRSKYFLLHTDLSDRSAKMLLDKLEYMVALVARYYGRLPKGLIECYVVRDLSQWKDIPLEPAGVTKIQQNAGVTISRSLGNQRKSIVYSCDDHGVVQHEAVHAYCAQTFGSTGPTWYSEGMAEMGQYWKKGNLAVEIPPAVIRYLTSSPPKKMADIVAAGQITGDSWQAYAWRWALCHLLANNSNYSARFKKLGLNMMSGGNATFETVYGDVAKEISFEYDLFVQDFGNGYRVDLCQWDWATRPVAISGQRRLKCNVEAGKGWQATRLKLNQGKEYEYVCVGEWKCSEEGKLVGGAGDEKGVGTLVGVIYSDYQLSQVIELGQKGKFVAPRDGHLFVRCRDDLTKLADNQGNLTVHFRRAKE